MRHCRSSPCGIAAHQNAALPLMSYAVIYMRHCRLCGWMDEANGVPTLKLHTETPRHRDIEAPRHRGGTETPRNPGIAAHQNAALPLMSYAVIYMRHCRLCGWMDEAKGVPTLILHTETPRHRGTETPRHRDTEKPRHRGTETQRHRETETPRHRDTETQRVAGKAVVSFYHCYDETLSLYTRSLLGDCSKLWVLRPEALLVRNVKI